MRNFFIYSILALTFICSSCGKINDELDSLDERLEQLELNVIPSIDKQIFSINRSISALEKTDEELGEYIDNLEATAKNLQEQINATDEALNEVKNSLKKEISTAKADVLAQLNAVKVNLENELSQINATIEKLKAKDSELDSKIEKLQTYVDEELQNTTDWVNATFATLKQYNQLVTEIATIKSQIETINKSITDLETRLTAKINKDIATAVSSLSAEIQQQVKDITMAYTEAIKSAKEEITVAYTAAIKSAISDLETSMKEWVGEQLSNYYTIAEVDAKLSLLEQQLKDRNENPDEALESLEEQIKEDIECINNELEALKTSLENTKGELTNAYKNAITEAINKNNGAITTQIADEINKINKRIDEEITTLNIEVATLNDKLSILQAQVFENTSDIALLLKRIQSVSYIPTYEDGKATMRLAGNTSRIKLSFEISPKNTITELESIWESALNIKAIYTATRTISFVDMPIISFEADKESGIITIVASGENLSNEFFAGTQTASVRLAISDGNISITSEYIPMVAVVISDNEIWYTSNNNKTVTPNDSNAFHASITNNVYKDVGIITFNADVTSIGSLAFQDCQSLTSVILPNNVKSIGFCAFNNCPKLAAIYGKHSSDDNRCVIINGKLEAFAPAGLESYIISSDVKSIGDDAFSSCSSLKSITIPNTVTSIGISAFLGCDSLTNITIPKSVAFIGEEAFKYCYSLTNVNIDDGITSIDGWAFSHCTSLTNIYCKAITPPTIGNDVFYNNATNRKIHVPTESVDAYKTADGWSDYADAIVGYDFE